MGRAALIYGAVLAVIASAWTASAVFSVRDLRGLANMDPRRPPGDSPVDAPRFNAYKNRGISVLWFGDSVSTAIRQDDADDARTPCLMDLAQSGLTEGGGINGRSCMFRTLHQNGFDGLHFLQYADYLKQMGQYPDVAVIGVNMRSLNRIGNNGFLGPFRANPFLKHPPRLQYIGMCYRGLAAWTREMLIGLFSAEQEPAHNENGHPGTAAKNAPWKEHPADQGDGLPGAPADRPSKDERLGSEKGYQMVYGDGYSVDQKTLGALLETGALLEKGGTLVLYYITPLDVTQLRVHEGKSTAENLERSIQEVDTKLRTAGFPVLDEHALLKDGFIDPPSEHLDAKDRSLLAGILVRWIKKSAAAHTPSLRAHSSPDASPRKKLPRLLHRSTP